MNHGIIQMFDTGTFSEMIINVLS